MAKPKTVEITKNGFRTVWRNGSERLTIEVDVYVDGAEKPVIEWVYPKVFGNSIANNAAIWFDQAALQARHELEKIGAQDVVEAL